MDRRVDDPDLRRVGVARRSCPAGRSRSRSPCCGRRCPAPRAARSPGCTCRSSSPAAAEFAPSSRPLSLASPLDVDQRRALGVDRADQLEPDVAGVRHHERVGDVAAGDDGVGRGGLGEGQAGLDDQHLGGVAVGHRRAGLARVARAGTACRSPSRCSSPAPTRRPGAVSPAAARAASRRCSSTPRRRRGCRRASVSPSTKVMARAAVVGRGRRPRSGPCPVLLDLVQVLGRARRRDVGAADRRRVGVEHDGDQRGLGQLRSRDAATAHGGDRPPDQRCPERVAARRRAGR